MTDTTLLFTGASVFGLMLIGIIFTVLEFRQLGERDKRRRLAHKKKPDTE